ncbi:MAG: MarR family winged helix-turn-helix transcriptional regulator [Rhizomicrobium sp.]
MSGAGLKRATRRKVPIRELHAAVIDLVALMNQPQRDDFLLKEAGVSLDRALFPLVSGIERFGPIGVVELADGTGRDHSTVSRQVAKLVELGIVERRPSATDARVNEAQLTKKGRRMTEALAAARQRLAAPVLEKWNQKDFDTLVRLLRRFVDDITAVDDDDN